MENEKLRWYHVVLMFPVGLFAIVLMPMVIIFNPDMPTYNETLYLIGMFGVIIICLGYSIGFLVSWKLKGYS